MDEFVDLVHRQVDRLSSLLNALLELLYRRESEFLQDESVVGRNDHQLRALFEPELLAQPARNRDLSLRRHGSYFRVVGAHVVILRKNSLRIGLNPPATTPKAPAVITQDRSGQRG